MSADLNSSSSSNSLSSTASPTVNSSTSPLTSVAVQPLCAGSDTEKCSAQSESRAEQAVVIRVDSMPHWPAKASGADDVLVTIDDLRQQPDVLLAPQPLRQDGLQLKRLAQHISDAIGYSADSEAFSVPNTPRVVDSAAKKKELAAQQRESHVVVIVPPTASGSPSLVKPMRRPSFGSEGESEEGYMSIEDGMEVAHERSTSYGPSRRNSTPQLKQPLAAGFGPKSLTPPRAPMAMSPSPSLGGVMSEGTMSDCSLSDEGVSVELPTKLRNVQSSQAGKRLRRNAKVNRQLMRFRRVKRHQALLEQQQDSSAQGDDMQLYDQDEPAMLRLSSYCSCEAFDFSELIDKLETSSTIEGTLTLFADVLHIKQKNRLSLAHHSRDIFLFEYGAVVFFNFTPAAEAEVLQWLKTFQNGSLAKPEMEDFDFSYGTESSVQNDEISLSSHSSLEKLSVACALAQCVKLSVFEQRIEQEVEANKHLSERLGRTGSVGLSQKEISRTIGRLFAERNNVNLHSDVLDTPECLWQQDRFKFVYDRLHQYLELGRRVDLLNKKMEIMKELFNMLNDEMGRKQATKLEWIIIWLIFFEVVVLIFYEMLLKDWLGFLQ